MKKLLVSALLSVAALPAFAQETTGEEPTIHTSVEAQPLPLLTPPPVYSREMKLANVSGIVLLSVVITDKGLVHSAEVVKSAHRDLERATLTAVKKWKFKPAQKAGSAVWVRLQIPVKFDLEE